MRHYLQENERSIRRDSWIIQAHREETMLVLSRKPSQQILIGSDVSITIVRVDRNCVRIGISAPPGVPILRQELVEKQQNRGQHSADQRHRTQAEVVGRTE
jgi:carbon storage regulator